MRELVRTVRLVFANAPFPAALLALLILSNGALYPLTVHLTRRTIDTAIAGATSGDLAVVLP